MSRRSSVRVFGAAAVLLLAATGVRAATDLTAPTPSTSSVDPGTVVVWDPKADSPGWQSPLPFDVQFLISIPIDEKVQSVDGRYVGDTSPQFCSQAFPRVRTYVDYGYGPRDLVTSERRQIQRMEGWKRNPKEEEAATTAVLDVVKGLLPNRYYCFEITKVRKLDADAATFQRALAEEVDHALRKVDRTIEGEDISPEEYEALRQGVIGAVDRELGPNERLVLPSKSFLDVSTETTDLPTTEKVGFNEILNAQSNRSKSIRDLDPNFDKAAELLGEVFKNREALAAARESVTSDQIAGLLAWIELDATPKQLAELADGTIDLQGAIAEQQGDTDTTVTRAKPWTEIWSPQELAVRRQNLESTLSSLKAVRDLAKTAAAPADTGNEEPPDGAADAAPGEANGPEPADAATTAALQARSLLNVLHRPEERFAAKQGAIGYVSFYLDNNFETLKGYLATRSKATADLLQYITRVEIERLLIQGSTTADYETQSNWYLGFDLGIAWAKDIEDFFGYLGTNIYFRPVNKKAPLSWSDFRRGQRTSELLKRLSITVGITLDDLEMALDTPGQFQAPTQETLTDGLIGQRQLVFGLGFRLNRYMRVSSGVLVFKDEDPDPLIDRSKLAWSPLVSISIDFDVRSAVGNRFNQ